MIDSFGRKINYARISVTDLCNLRCLYCMPEEGVEKKHCGEILRIEEIIIIAEALTELGIDKIRLTGGEPLVRHGFLTLVEKIGSMQGIRDLAVTTNGVLLPELGQPLIDAGLKRVNISLDTFDRDKYAKITRGGDVDRVMAGIKTALSLGFEQVKINVVLMEGFNDDEIEAFTSLTMDQPLDVRFIEIMPFEGQHAFAEGRFLPATAVLNRCPDLKPVQSEDPSAPAQYYQFPGAKGRVGLIEPLSHGFCSSCNRLRITADGHLLTCLHCREAKDLRPYLGDKETLKQVIRKEIDRKPGTHKIGDGPLMDRDMGKIGG
jgi:cyclic pyranopterin phosphate synthase